MTSVLLVIDTQRNMLLPPEPVPDAAVVGAAIEHAIAARPRGRRPGRAHQEQRRGR